MKTLQQRSLEWDQQFTYKAWQLQPTDVKGRVAAAWLAGYNACLEARRRRRSKSDTGVNNAAPKG